MSMNATEASPSAAATLRATVVLPEPDPPAMPMMSGFMKVSCTGCAKGGERGICHGRVSRAERADGRRAGEDSRQSARLASPQRRRPAGALVPERLVDGATPRVAFPMRIATLLRPRSRRRGRLCPPRSPRHLGLRSVPSPRRSAGPRTTTPSISSSPATTDVHGRIRGWDYESNRPDPARGLSRAATIVDSVRAVGAGPRRAARRRRPAAGQLAHVRRGARRASVSAASGHRRDERDALRRGGRRQSRVQLRRPVPRPDARAGAVSLPRRERLPAGRRARVPALDADRARRRARRHRRRHDARRRWSGTATTSPAGSSSATSCPRCAARWRTCAPPARTSWSSRCTPGSTGASSYDTVAHRRAERERRGARRARSAGHRPDPLRPLAPGDGRHA